jgi:cytochrome c553
LDLLSIVFPRCAAVSEVENVLRAFFCAFAAAGLLSISTISARSQIPNDMAARVEACTPCHGKDGGGTGDAYFPRLAGKPAGYLNNQLQAFRSGRRKYPPMNYLLEYLPDEYLAAMATYFSSLHPPAPPGAAAPSEASIDLLARGESLVRRGDPGKDVPACASCHGPSLTGQEPGVPGLLGLRASYISAQLGAWRYGTRTALAPDCMQIVAGHLTEDDVRSVAAWLSAQPLPPHYMPAAKGSFVLPFACGSQPQ